MKIKMKENYVAKADANGGSTMLYMKDKEYNFEAGWQVKLGAIMIERGKAEKSVATTEKKIVKPAETKVKKILKKVMGKKKK